MHRGGRSWFTQHWLPCRTGEQQSPFPHVWCDQPCLACLHEVLNLSEMGQLKSTATRVMLPKILQHSKYSGNTSLEVLRGPCPSPWYRFGSDESETAAAAWLCPHWHCALGLGKAQAELMRFNGSLRDPLDCLYPHTTSI